MTSNKPTVLYMASLEGNPVHNQKVYSTSSGLYLVSYDVFVAYKPHTGSVGACRGIKWDYSKTTARYVRLFLHGYSVDTLPINDIQAMYEHDVKGG